MSGVIEADIQSTGEAVLEPSLLEQVIQATKQTEPNYAKQMLSVLTESALQGTVKWNKSLVASVNQAIAELDKLISSQLTHIIHNDDFKKMEGSWRGLHYLISQAETSVSLKIKLIDMSKQELSKDLDKAVDFDQSQLFKKIYSNEFGMPGGEPYGLLVGDYEFTNHPEDIAMLRSISGVAAGAFCPFIAAANSNIMGLDNWSDLNTPMDLEKIFDTMEYAKWRSFRETDDSRFVSLTMPRALARLPYGQATLPVEAFDFEETLNQSGQSKQMAHDDYCWMNAAYVLAEGIANSQAQFGWATSIRGAENGGKVENLPLHTFQSDDGDIDAQCPTEIGITDRREAELSKLGFLPLCHYKNTDYAVFFGGQTTQKPKKYDKPEATANAAISTRLPYLLATSRFAHFLKVMARDKIGAFMEVEDCEAWLNRWILTYVNGNPSTAAEMKAKYPLAEAKVKVQAIPGQPGAYNAVAWLRPWLQLEELTTSMRLVARIPKLEG